MKFHWKNKYLYWGLTAFGVVSASMLFYFLLFRMEVVFGTFRKLISIMMPVICGLVIAYLLIPIVNFQERHFYRYLIGKRHIHPSKGQKKFVRYVSIVFALIFGGLIIYSLISMIMPSIIESIISIINDSPRYFQNIRHWLESLLKDNPEWESTVFSYIEQYSPKLETFLNVQILPQLKSILQHLSTGVFGTLVFIKNLLIGLIISIYLMAGKEEFVTQSKMFVYAFLSTEHANNVVKGVRFAHRTFIGFIIGKIVDSIIIGILCYVGTKIIGTPYAMLVSVVVGVTNVIPFFGPYLGAIPTAFIILMVNPVQCLYFLIFILLLQQFDGNILGPKILGNSTGLSSFMVIVAILLFGGIMGIPGMIIGVPTLAIIMAGIKTFRAYNLRQKSMPMDENVYTHMDYMDPENLHPVDFAVDKSGMDIERNKDEKEEDEKK
nr:AI-2E family transporter [uncultured Blautia sp.]